MPHPPSRRARHPPPRGRWALVCSRCGLSFPPLEGCPNGTEWLESAECRCWLFVTRHTGTGAPQIRMYLWGSIRPVSTDIIIIRNNGNIHTYPIISNIQGNTMDPDLRRGDGRVRIYPLTLLSFPRPGSPQIRMYLWGG